MLHRLLFFLRRLGLDASRWLGSWRLSIVLMVVLALYQALLAVYSTSTPSQVVKNIASLAVFQLLYVLLLLNTAICFWRRVPRLRREMKGAALRRRLAALGSYLFHGAFLLVALGFLTSFVARHEADVWVGVGEAFEGRPDQFLAQSPPRILSPSPWGDRGGETPWRVPAADFTVETITPEFWRDQMLFTTLEAELVLPGGRRATTRINRPLYSPPATFLRLSGFGYTPRWEIRDNQGRTVDTAFAKLNVFPPGQRDFFQVPRFPHRFYVELLPDFAEDDDGVPMSRTLNLVHPAVVVQVWRGRVDLGAGVLEGGEGYAFEGLELFFPEIRYWGQFSIVRDPGMPILFLGYLVGLVGLVFKLPGAGKGRAAENDG